MKRKILIAECGDGCELKAGNQSGYASTEAAFRAAKRLAVKSGQMHVVAEYEIYPDGDRDCIDVLGYEYPDE